MLTSPPCPTLPHFRLAILDRQITLSRWGPALAALPMLSQLKALTQSEADYADLRLIGNPAERELLITFAESVPRDSSRTVLKDWGAAVGAARIWLVDELIDPQGEPRDDAVALAKCPGCGIEITGRGAHFWSRVHTYGFFPGRCAMCGGTVPQMRLSGDHAEAGEARG